MAGVNIILSVAQPDIRNTQIRLSCEETEIPEWIICIFIPIIRCLSSICQNAQSIISYPFHQVIQDPDMYFSYLSTDRLAFFYWQIAAKRVSQTQSWLICNDSIQKIDSVAFLMRLLSDGLLIEMHLLFSSDSYKKKKPFICRAECYY